MPTHRPLLADLTDGWAARGWSLADLDRIVMMADPPEDPPADPPEDPPADPPADPPEDETDPVKLRAEADKWKALARKHEGRAKDNAQAKKDLDKLQREKATDDERAKLDAKDEGKAEARKELAPKLLAAEVKAAAGDRMTKEARETLLEGLDATKFLTDDGDVDTDKVATLIEGIAAPPGKGKPADLGQGRRRTDDGKPSVSAGRDRYEEKHSKKK
jgi:hypothetical protein